MVSYEAEAAEIAAVFQAKLAGLRRRLRPSEIPAAAKALQDERQSALRAMRERRTIERVSSQIEREKTQPPPPSPA